jgi:hypothetical protein
MKANILSFSKIIDSTHGAREHYHIPKYQREYTWGKRNWEALLQDLLENDIGYFVGALIVVKDSEDENHACQTIYEVVDGQQRLTTVSLLMLALYEKLVGLRDTAQFEDEDDRAYFDTCLVDLRTKLVLKVKKEEDHTEQHKRGWLEKGKCCYLRVQPSSQSDNLADYRYALGGAGLIAASESPVRFGNRRISRGLAFFRDNLPEQIDELLTILAKINQLQFVFISVGSQADAFTLFETLNNRGVPLSAIDIVKNKMLSEMQKQRGVDVDSSFEQWQQIVDNIEDIIDQERFLRQFYNANHWNELIRVSGVTRASKAKIISIYEKVINRNPQGVFDRLCEAAAQYGPLICPDLYELEEDVGLALFDLKCINASPSYQLLLYLFMLDDGVLVEDDFMLRAINLMRKFYVRRNVTDFPGTAALDQAHVDTIAACQKQIDVCSSLSFDFFQSQVLLAGKFSTQEEFRASLSGDIYAENAGMARYLLIKLDEEHHTREYAPDLWARNKSDKYIWTIEHILPQCERLSREWIQDLANGDQAAASELHWSHVNLLGNLTLSGYNSKLSNASFARKQTLSGDKKVGDQKIAIGYRNKLALNTMKFESSGRPTSLSKTNTWNADLISARTEHMVNRLVDMFAFDSE